jgi:hypothetical protein
MRSLRSVLNQNIFQYPDIQQQKSLVGHMVKSRSCFWAQRQRIGPSNWTAKAIAGALVRPEGVIRALEARRQGETVPVRRLDIWPLPEYMRRKATCGGPQCLSSLDRVLMKFRTIK